MTQAIDERRTVFSERRRPNSHGVSVTNRCALKKRGAFNAVGLAEQLSNRDPRFVRIILPFGDRVRDEIIESKQPVMRSRQRGDSPKTFCAAKDRPSSTRRSAIRIMLKNRAAILHHQYGDSAFALGIFCRADAIRGI